MTSKRRAPKNLLTHRTANVSIHRNGLSIEVANVPATDAATVAASLLDAIRGLIQAGYEELIVDGGSQHADPIAASEEPDEPDLQLPPTARPTPKRIGFVK